MNITFKEIFTTSLYLTAVTLGVIIYHYFWGDSSLYKNLRDSTNTIEYVEPKVIKREPKYQIQIYGYNAIVTDSVYYQGGCINFYNMEGYHTTVCGNYILTKLK